MPTGVNMRQEATTILFDLLGDLKEVESIEHNTHSSNIIHITFNGQVILSDSVSLGPTVVLTNLSQSNAP